MLLPFILVFYNADIGFLLKAKLPGIHLAAPIYAAPFPVKTTAIVCRMILRSVIALRLAM